MRLHWRQVAPALIIGLILGLWVSAWLPMGALWRMRHGDPRHLVEKLSADLRLNESQKTAIQTVMDSNREKAKALHEESLGRFEALRASMRVDIEKVLDSNQIEKFRAIQKRWDERHDKWRKAH